MHMIGIGMFSYIYQIVKEVVFFQLKSSDNPLNLKSFCTQTILFLTAPAPAPAPRKIIVPHAVISLPIDKGSLPERADREWPYGEDQLPKMCRAQSFYWSGSLSRRN